MLGKNSWLATWAVICTSTGLAQSNVPEDLDAILSFEIEHETVLPAGWRGGPPDTLSVDDSVRHAGQWSGRIDRTGESSQEFSSLTLSLPANVVGSTVTLTAWVRGRSVEDFFGLWLRQDGAAGVVDFTNNYNLGLKGDQDWVEVSVSAQLSTLAQEFHFGLVLGGRGTVWLDDVRFFVDDISYVEAPKRLPVVLSFISDKEFDNGSGISDTQLIDSPIEDIATVIEIWGFVKYHHPKVAAGDVHIDYELLRLLSAILDKNNSVTRNQLLLDWIRGLGPIPPCTECARVPVDLHLQPPVEWIHDSTRFGKDLSTSLIAIYRNRPVSGQHVFISQVRRVGNAKFINESAYENLEQVDAGFRLLALARLWNIVRYWFPYRDLMDSTWSDTLRVSIPRLAGPLDDNGYARELIQVIVEIRDTHANLWGSLDARPPAGNCYLDAAFRFVEGEPVVWALESPDSTGLRIGDALLRLDAKSVEQLVMEWRPFYAASNEPTRLRDIGRNLSKGQCGESHMQIRRIINGGTQNLELLVTRTEREDGGRRKWYTHDRIGETFQVLPGDVAYIKLSSIEAGNVSEHLQIAQDLKGLVVDIRNYPSAFMVFELGQHLVTSIQPFAKFTKADPANPGAFVWTENVELHPKSPAFGGKVAILVDEVSQSQAEYTAMALRVTKHAMVVGSTTAGADGNVSAISLPGGLRTIVSGIGVFYPDGTPTQRIGIIPDIKVEPTIEGIRAGRDEVLEAALRYILGEDATEEEIRSFAARP